MLKYISFTKRKYVLYVLICTVIFTTLILLSCFIAGNCNVFQWDITGRLAIVVLFVGLSSLIIGILEDSHG